MNGVDNECGIRLSWQLVSQFVSWEFCRYVCEQKNETTEDMDVLALLRNMIVQRTEKTIAEVTKHEIVAKFLMELKVLDECRYPFIKTLSDTVVKICPELEAAVHKLMRHLASFLSVITNDEECFKKELIKERIEITIAEFSKEAGNVMPQPELLQMVKSWKVKHQPTQPNIPQRKILYNHLLYEKVLELIHFEQILPSESKLIALALQEDEVFQKILRSSDAEPDSEEPDSDIFSSQSSQAMESKFSQEFEKNAQQKVLNAASIPENYNRDAIPLHTLPNSYDVPNPFTGHSSVTDPKSVVDTATAPENCPEDVIPFDTLVGAYDIPSTFTIHKSAEDPTPYEEHGSKVSDTYPVLTAERPPLSPAHPLQIEAQTVSFANDHNNANESGLQFAQSSARESDSDCSVQERVNQKLSRFLSSKNVEHEDDSPENSDCDANPGFRFLTPTYYKKDPNPEVAAKSKVIWISDTESFDSSINTVSNSQSVTHGSQKADPNWTKDFSLQKAFYPSKLRKKPVKKRSKAKVLSDFEESNKNGALDDSPDHISDKSHDTVLSPAKPAKKRTQAKVLSDSEESNKSDALDDIPDRINNESHDAVLSPAKRRPLRKMIKLYKSPSTSYADFHVVKRPVRISVERITPNPSSPVSPFTSTSSSSSSNSNSSPKIYSGVKDTLAGKNSKKTVPKLPLTKKTAPNVQFTIDAKPAKKKKPAAANSTKKQKCQHCNSSYKTKIALKRHIFLKHTKHNTPDDIEDNSDLS